MNDVIKRVGIMTLYFNYNYGAVLQAYALQRVISQMGDSERFLGVKFDVKDIRYLRQIDYTISEPQKKVALTTRLRNLKFKNVINKIQKNFLTKKVELRDKKRKQLFDEFVNNNIEECIIPQNGNINSLNELFDIFVCGSDNIWNRHLFDGRFMLDFVNDEKVKIAYAPGMSTDYLSPSQEIVYKRNTSRLNAISCREKNGAKVLERLLGKEVFIALDPTLLISVEDWKAIERKPTSNDIPERYILCYFCENNKYTCEHVAQIEKRTELPIIAVPNMTGHFNLSGKNIIKYTEAGPCELLYLIKNATYVLTDSFHGTVFAIQYKKQFLSFRRFFDEKNGPLNYRVDNLLESANIDSLKIISNSKQDLYERLIAPIDWDAVNSNIVEKRKNSLKFLSDALAT